MRLRAVVTGIGLALGIASGGGGGAAFSPASLFAANEPGYVYDNNDFGNPTTWRVNELLWTQELDNAVWAKRANVTVTANQGPSGFTDLDRVVNSVSSGNAAGTYQFAISRTAGATFSVSVTLATESGTTDVWIGIRTESGGSPEGHTLVTATTTPQVFTTTYTFSAGGLGRVYAELSPNVVGVPFLAGRVQINAGATALPYQRITDFNSDYLAAFPNTTLYTDSFGLQPATVNGLVGLQLDKSRNLATSVAGSVTGWTNGASPFSTFTPSGSNLTVAATAYSTCASTPTFSIVDGRYYKVTVNVTALTSSINLYIGTTGATLSTKPQLVLGTRTYFLRATSASAGVGVCLESSAGAGTTINVLSILELPGLPRFQPTTASRPILRGTPTGANLATAFAGGGAGWTYSGGDFVATGSAATTSAGVVSPAVVIGRTYRIKYTVAITSGTIRAVGGGVNGTQRTVSGTYEEYTTATATTAFIMQPTVAYTGSVSAIEIFDVSAGAVQAPYGLQYDGVDDFFLTASADFTATDKVTLAHGVRKFADANGLIVELSTTSAATAGTFGMVAGGGSTANYELSLFGTAACSYLIASDALPTTDVVSCVFNIAGADHTTEIVPQVDGVTTAPVGGVAGPAGTGNLGNFPMYWGRRGGTTQPRNGLDFGGWGIGRLLTAAEYTNGKSWTANRTGVVL